MFTAMEEVVGRGKEVMMEQQDEQVGRRGGGVDDGVNGGAGFDVEAQLPRLRSHA
jgi:hypothetical protein